AFDHELSFPRDEEHLSAASREVAAGERLEPGLALGGAGGGGGGGVGTGGPCRGGRGRRTASGQGNEREQSGEQRADHAPTLSSVHDDGRTALRQVGGATACRDPVAGCDA